MEALSARWGWSRRAPGKAVYAILTREGMTDGGHLRPADAGRHRRDYSPQYVKLARIIRGKIESGEYKHGDPIPAVALVHEHKVSMQVAWRALAVLAANRYLTRPAPFKPYHVTWDASARLTRRARG